MGSILSQKMVEWIEVPQSVLYAINRKQIWILLRAMEVFKVEFDWMIYLQMKKY